MRRAIVSGVIATVALALLAGPAAASRTLQNSQVVEAATVPGKTLEAPCGVALPASGQYYVSTYYAHAVDVFSQAGTFSSRIEAAGAPEGPCQLVLGSGGELYANLWHEGVVRLTPTAQSFDRHNSTGVALDASGRLYVDDRTYIAVYEPSGEEVGRLGVGQLTDAYGLAISGARAYVADAGTETIKAFAIGGEEDDPPSLELDGFQTPQGHFVSLEDAALAADPTNGHLLAIDEVGPGYEHPKAALYEFSPSGEYLGQVGTGLIDGGPSGMVVSSTGFLYVTSGNSEEGALRSYSSYSGAEPLALASPSSSSAVGSAASSTDQARESSSQTVARRDPSGPPASASEVIRRGKVVVGLHAFLTPKKLPRRGSAPVRFSLAAKISPVKGSVPPQLRTIEIEINSHGQIDPKALPTCNLEMIQPATNSAALAACRRSLVGQGSFSAKVLISQQAPFPSQGKIYAFNGTWHGKPAILAHVYGTEPVPTSSTIPFVISNTGHGTYGTTLRASLPHVTSKWGYVTGISMSLGSGPTSPRRPYLAAGCPAPKGFSSALFKLSRARLAFSDGQKVSSVLSGTCRAAG